MGRIQAGTGGVRLRPQNSAYRMRPVRWKSPQCSCLCEI